MRSLRICQGRPVPVESCICPWSHLGPSKPSSAAYMQGDQAAAQKELQALGNVSTAEFRTVRQPVARNAQSLGQFKKAAEITRQSLRGAPEGAVEAASRNEAATAALFRGDCGPEREYLSTLQSPDPDSPQLPRHPVSHGTLRGSGRGARSSPMKSPSCIRGTRSGTATCCPAFAPPSLFAAASRRKHWKPWRRFHRNWRLAK